MEKHNININVTLDNEKMPEHIDWNASGSSVAEPNQAKAFMLSIWDGQEKTALRMDLWTKRMMVDEMNDFFFQTMMTMADTFTRATRNEALSNEIREFARGFKKKADDALMKEENENKQ
ncbi:MAG: gliding motility protein GldC [Taibaiella sp.]|nr:gliding motility protein GldC [Taibaiella sp.]